MCDACDMARQPVVITPSYRGKDGQHYPLPPRTATLEVFDLAVERYFAQTTELFQGFHRPFFDGLRERLEQVLQGSP